MTSVIFFSSGLSEKIAQSPRWFLNNFILLKISREFQHFMIGA